MDITNAILFLPVSFFFVRIYEVINNRKQLNLNKKKKEKI